MSLPNEEESKGLGDSLSKFIKKASFGKIKECEPCKRRKEALNKLFPYDKDEKKREDS